MLRGIGTTGMTTSQATTTCTNLYNEILLRAPDSGGLANCVNGMVAGTLTPEQEEQSMLNSSEFKGSAADQAAWGAGGTIPTVAPQPYSNPVSSAASPMPVYTTQTGSDTQAVSGSTSGMSATDLLLIGGGLLALLLMGGKGR